MKIKVRRPVLNIRRNLRHLSSCLKQTVHSLSCLFILSDHMLLVCGFSWCRLEAKPSKYSPEAHISGSPFNDLNAAKANRQSYSHFPGLLWMQDQCTTKIETWAFQASMSSNSASAWEKDALRKQIQDIAARTSHFLFRAWSANSGGGIQGLNSRDGIFPHAFLDNALWKAPQSMCDLNRETI